MSYREDVNDSAYIDPPAGAQHVARVRIDESTAVAILDMLFEVTQEMGFISKAVTVPSWKYSHPEIFKQVTGDLERLLEDVAEVERV